MRYSLLSFLKLSGKVIIFHPIPYGKMYNIKHIKKYMPENTVHITLPSGIILRFLKTKSFDRPGVFIPENHYLFNLPLMDNYIDHRHDVFGGEIADNPDIISAEFTEIIKREIGLNNYEELIKLLP
jgi:hypothetical protein